MLCFTLYLRAIPSTNPRGRLYFERQLTEGFLRYEFFFFWGGGEGLIFGGAYTWRGLISEFYGTLLEKKLDRHVLATLPLLSQRFIWFN